MRSFFVKYNDGKLEFYPSAVAAAQVWDCTSQAVLYMIAKCEGTKLSDKKPLRTSRIAARWGIEDIITLEDIDRLNEHYDGLFKWVNGN